MTTSEFVLLQREGYTHVRECGKAGVCGLHRMMYTTGLFCGLDRTGYSHRYCYELRADAIAALAAWDGEGDPPGPWIKRKGLGEEVLGPGAIG